MFAWKSNISRNEHSFELKLLWISKDLCNSPMGEIADQNRRITVLRSTEKWLEESVKRRKLLKEEDWAKVPLGSVWPLYTQLNEIWLQEKGGYHPQIVPSLVRSLLTGSMRPWFLFIVSKTSRNSFSWRSGFLHCKEGRCSEEPNNSFVIKFGNAFLQQPAKGVWWVANSETFGRFTTVINPVNYVTKT